MVPGMVAVEDLQDSRLEALAADAQSRHPCGGPSAEVFSVNIDRVGLHADLDLFGPLGADGGLEMIHRMAKGVESPYRWRSSAEIDCMNGAPLKFVLSPLKLADEPFGVALVRNTRPHVDREVAIGAFARAEGNVDVDAHRLIAAAAHRRVSGGRMWHGSRCFVWVAHSIL